MTRFPLHARLQALQIVNRATERDLRHQQAFSGFGQRRREVRFVVQPLQFGRAQDTHGVLLPEGR